VENPTLARATDIQRDESRLVAKPPGSVPPVFLPHLLALIAAIGIYEIPDPRLGLWFLFALSALYGLAMVAFRGRGYLVPSGVYFLASGVFIGLAAFYLLQAEPFNTYDELRTWGVIAFVTTAATGIVVTAFSIRWQLSWPSSRQLKAQESPTPAQPPVHFHLLAIVLVFLSLNGYLIAFNQAVADALGVTGVMMLVLAASSRRLRMRWFGDVAWVAVALIVPAVYLVLTFDGGGRLTIAGLGVACLTAWNLIRPRPIQKVLVVLAIPLFLLYSGVDRLNEDNRKVGESRDVIASGDGLESMYSPLDTWTELASISDDELRRTGAADIGPRWGTTFLTTAALPVPRSVWQDKPKGFGAELTEILRPTLLREKRIAEEHSMAGLVNGEFFVNFGLYGLLVLPFAIGWFLAKLDQAHLRLTRTGLRNADDWWKATILVCLVSSLGDLFWVGTFTFLARGGMAALIAFVLWRFTTRNPASARAG
jgi:hypothetical protein